MEFKEIHFSSLQTSQKYKISWNQHIYTATFYQFYTHGCIYFIKLYRKGIQLPYIRFHTFMDCKIYQPIFQKEQIQQAMENRATNLVLQRITGDPYFFWGLCPRATL